MDKTISAIKNYFQNIDTAIIAFSAGVDSSLLAFLARKFLDKPKVLAVISASASLKRCDLDEGIEFCKTHDIPLKIIDTKEFDDPKFNKNPADRCFHCKSALFCELKTIAQKENFKEIFVGQNLDDNNDYRPGMRAATEHGITSPFIDLGIDKKMIRAIAKHFELKCFDKPAAPCLSSRVPYNETITIEKMKQVESGENFLKLLGFPINRVRHYGQTAKIEVPNDRVIELQALSKKIEAKLKEFGFNNIEFDSEGFVSGKLNRSLNL